MEELQQLGPRLRAARQDRGWTLEDLAGRSGISVSTLSRLESGKRQASLELLLPITKQLGIRIDDLLAHRDRDPRVHRTPVTRGGMTISPLTREESDVRAFKLTYPAEAPERTFQVHDGHEWLYVLSGKLLLELGEQELVLVPGEAAEFDTTTPHRMRASGGAPAEVLSIFNIAGERVHLHSHIGETSDDDTASPGGDATSPGSGDNAKVASEHDAAH